MAKKRQKPDEEYQQLSLNFDIPVNLNSERSDDPDDDWLQDEELGSNFQTSDRTIEPQTRDLLTLKLLREAIQSQNPGDRVMADFAEYVLPNLLRVAIGVTAKGGKFFDELDRKQGKENVRRDNAGDQSLNTHLLNGLFPANLIEQRLEKLDTTVRRSVGEKERRLVIAGFILHDFEKFPDVPNDCRKLPLEKHRQIIDEKVRQLGLDRFINPDDPDAYREYIDDLLCLAYNAQRRWDTNWNFSEFGLNPVLRDRTLRSLSDLTCLADSLASIIKHPQDAENTRLNELIHSLSDGQLKFTYHSIAENRGVLTNVVNNALMEVHTALNTDDCTYYEPLLYLPTGVIYLARSDAPAISIADLPERVVSKIKQLCAGQLQRRQTGFGRDGKGMKYADYYNLFFDASELMLVAVDATLRILKIGKNSVAKSRSDNLIKFQRQDVLSADYNFKFDDDIRIDQIAELGDLVSRKIWGEQVNTIEAARKKDKKLPALTHLDIVDEIAKFWNLSEYLPALREIQRINERLKELKLKGNTGGVPYEWYYLAAKYLEHHPGIEDVREVYEQAIAHISQMIKPILSQYKLPDGWDDLRLWVTRVVMLPGNTPLDTASSNVFLDELERYQLAKKQGRGRQLICSISHSAYTVTEQMESAVLFTPQVYTNKQMLGGSNAKRNISSIAGLEMMLRQILMNQTQAVGKKFEDGKYRYLYFYPTYYFTPETNKFLQKAYTSIAQTRFDTSIRNHFISKDLQADFGRDRYQSIDAFLIDENIEPGKDRTFKLSYPEDQPLTFYFMALPPGRDATDTESWVMPTWLAFAFPMILDVKTVVSESPIPPFNDGAEFEESVFLDSVPQAFRVLTKRDRFRLDYILEGWEENGKKYPAPLNALTAAYAIHLDVNAKQGKSGYDANWGKLSELAKDFETSLLYVFAYLKNWVRKQKLDAPSLSKIKLYAHSFYPCFDPYVTYKPESEDLIVEAESPLNHPKKLTELYRKFYRAKSTPGKPTKSNAILKPIDEAADVILKAYKEEGFNLVQTVAAKIFKLMERVHNSTAEGRWVIAKRDEEREAIMDFANYFVVEVFEKSFAGDRARLAGRQLNLIRDTCEFLYRLEGDKKYRARKEQASENDLEDSDSDNDD
ncbi:MULTISPECIES: type I-D CRISPR-associated protein Cas10d/Csc3 [unclassified Microcoleus]|uniref:type I-D CRISPR-associated protein Cas10d/Csc3 n=1 Tax=unclassified Microcoleus TaxID=2642155 RepID=UPI001DEF4BED|nr:MULTISPECIES: type I-D CRISPR-associated protein Cas10d/Csc3 [unclassified Microcoleus]MCC3524076.1 type I-D CRISPR-associated protein Cas10d/Csc3 [Microcoleus sp. PH2017_20_SFW_D_A]MCC3554416.1 type I-D CRISPR-associated protein Cas10d/Csc3 [Microcoleus sp. PH2017_35_SFW_U_B]MCC3566908.1 type I-D CRISPR-associated protein Cas10d/Csc3 [Microcoleus sp. PH2017_31_RDM_U_A]MCC3579297.1 type I-D CRISPR-associated protein Cas10d/Csc3 [Microcoleus sp. PH2017_32_RDM_D_A]MCC3617342.1 type I-D CRISPR